LSTARAVDSLAPHTGGLAVVVVVDHSDASGELLEPRAGIELIVPGANAGFAAGCNTGIRRLSESGCSHFLLFNNDAIAEEGCVDSLLRGFRANTSAGVIAPLILREDGRVESAGICLGRLTGRHRLVNNGSHPPFPGPLRRVMAVAGTAMMVSRACYEAVGGLDEALFCYFEDLDFCLRARATGHEISVDPAARVRHLRGRPSSDAIYYSCRNHLVILRRHFPLVRGDRLRSLLVPSWYLLFLLRHGRLGCPSDRSAIRQGVTDARSYPPALGRRRASPR